MYIIRIYSFVHSLYYECPDLSQTCRAVQQFSRSRLKSMYKSLAYGSLFTKFFLCSPDTLRGLLRR